MKKWCVLGIRWMVLFLMAFFYCHHTDVINAQSPGYDIQGRVTNSGGNPIPGVQIAVGNMTTQTDFEGNYIIQGLPAGRYHVTVNMVNYSFISSSPMPIEVPRDKTVDFVGTPLFHSVSGRITDHFGRGIQNVDIFVDGVFSAKTNVHGFYEVGGLAVGKHTIAPQLTQFTFQPASREVVLPMSGVMVNFQAQSIVAYSLDGTIVRSNNPEIGVMGVKVSVGELYQTRSDGQGRFIIRGIPPGDYEIKAELNGYQLNLPQPPVVTFPPSQSLSLIATPKMNAIKGRILEMGSGEPVPGVTISVGCGHTAKSDTAGFYSITGLPDGVFTISPQLDNYKFTPNQSILSLPMDGYVDFIAEPLSTRGGSVSGTITVNEEPLAGVEILSPVGKSISNVHGYYKIANMPNGTYEIKPQMKGFSFSPEVRVVSVPNDGAVDFEATALDYLISGVVANAEENPVAGAIVKAGVGLQAATNANGRYIIAGLPENSTPYILSVSLDGSIFTSNQSMPITVPPSRDDIHFTSASATLYGQIDGTITYANDQPLAGALVVAKPVDQSAEVSFPSCCCPEDERIYTAYTDMDGYYSIGGLPAGEYEVSVNKSGHSFESLLPMPITAPRTGVNFQADVLPNTYGLSGTITDISTSTGLHGVQVYLKEGSDYSGMTNRNGYYVIGGIPAGNYTPQPVLFGYTFRATTSLPINFNGNTQPLRQANFEASSMLSAGAPFFAIHGRIINALGQGVPFVPIQINPNQPYSIMTDTNGSYAFHWLDSTQTYTLTPQKTGCTFAPTVRTYGFVPPGYPEEQNFSAECSYTLTFWVKDKSGAGINGVRVTAKPSPADPERSEVEAVESDNVGEYIFNNLRDGVYVIQPVREGYTFVPSSFLINIPSELLLPTFLGYSTETIYTVSGKVSDMEGKPLSGVTITDDGGNKVVTDSDGFYQLSFSIESLTPGANSIKITPISASYHFTPATRVVDISSLQGQTTLDPNQSDIVNQDFVGQRR